MGIRRTSLLFLGALIAIAATSRAQCLAWAPGFGMPGTDAPVLAFATFDDGSGGGPALYLGGEFRKAGSETARRIMKWDGATWSDVGSGLDGIVRALTVFDDGSGPALYAGGEFGLAGLGIGAVSVTRIARWNGTSWSALGSGGPNNRVRALAVSDAGGSPALYAGGDFSIAGGTNANHVARWNGSAWSAVGTGTNGSVHTLASFDDGQGGGTALYVGGDFSLAGGVVASDIARWNGSAWSAVGPGLVGTVHAMTVFDDGGGTRLYLGGEFSAGGGMGSRVASWDGVAFAPLPPGLNDDVHALTVYDDGLGGGGRLVAGGIFAFNGDGTLPLKRLAAWDGSSWAALGGGISSAVDGNVVALAAYDSGSGPRLYAGGAFLEVEQKIVSHVAAFDGTSWSRLGTERGLPDLVTELESSHAPPDAGATHYARMPMQGVIRLDATGWTRIGVENTYPNTFSVLRVHDDGSGPALYVGGQFVVMNGSAARGLARWNGSAWSAVGGGLSAIATVWAIEPLVLGGGSEQLYVGGKFASAGGVQVNNIASWDGSTWAALGSGVGGNSFPLVTAVAAFDDGSGGGADLYAAGLFTTAGGMPATRIARWDGAQWSALGSGLNDEPRALAVYDDGMEAALYVGGLFTDAGGVSANHVARWNGTTWSALGAGTDSFVYALKVFDDGAGDGPVLYVSGEFANAGGMPANGLAKWNGTSWSPMPAGLPSNSAVIAMTAFDGGAGKGTDLYVGGYSSLGLTDTGLFARWLGCGVPGTRYCFGDGLDPVVTADCPCSNFGDPGRGCANSNAALGGALLTASGATNPNTVLLTGTNIVNNTLCTFMRGKNHDPQAAVFGDGIKCLTSPLFRFGQQHSGQIGNPLFTVSVAAPTEIPGFTWHYTIQYRNPTPGFCNPGLFNASNGYTIAW